MNRTLQAVVLVGGQGTRLRPLTLTTPKPLAPLANRPVIEHIVAWLASYGVREILLATQYRAQSFDRWLRIWRRRHPDVTIMAIEEPEPRGTAGAVAHVAPQLRGSVVVVNGDNLLNLDLAAMLRAHEARGTVATISTDEVDDPTGRGVVVSDGQGRVRAFQEKPAPGTALARTVNTGVYLLEPSAVAAIPRDRFCAFEQDVFPALIDSGAAVRAFQSRHIWIDTGTPSGYLRAQQAVLDGQASAAAGTRIGTAWIDESVTIDSAAQIDGPIAVGFGSSIAAGAQVDRSSIGRECHVLTGARIERSAIWDGCQIEPNAAIHGSILGYNCYVGDGARVHSSILGDGCIIRAGVELAPGTLIPPRTTVELTNG